MRKVHFNVKAVILVPVAVNLELFTEADDNANITRIAEQFVKGKPLTGTDNVSIMGFEFPTTPPIVTTLGDTKGTPVDVDGDEFTPEDFFDKTAKVVSCDVTDSR
jgi:hypothetical protein